MVAVVICHGQQAVVDALVARCSTEPDLSPVTGSVDCANIASLVSLLQPDVLVIAASAASPTNGQQIVETVQSGKRLKPRPAILLLAPGSRADVAVEAVAAGADGWVAEEAPVEE